MKQPMHEIGQQLERIGIALEGIFDVLQELNDRDDESHTHGTDGRYKRVVSSSVYD